MNKKILKGIFVHYGHEKFMMRKWKKIKNAWRKPLGGLWASPLHSKWGWYQWCKVEEWEMRPLSLKFKFKLKDESKVYVIDSLLDLERCPMTESVLGGFSIDFEKMAQKYDAIFLTEKGEVETRHSKPTLYSWDCESLVVMNKDIIKVI